MLQVGLDLGTRITCREPGSGYGQSEMTGKQDRAWGLEPEPLLSVPRTTLSRLPWWFKVGHFGHS